MKSTELRQGNILDYYGQIVIVLEIKRNENIELGYFTNSIGFERKLTEKHSPKQIPLTEEWLLKFGYDLITENHYAIPGHLIWKCNDLFMCDKNGRIIKHVHQLQNLYFALTGEELQIK